MASLASINIRFSADLKQFSSQMQNVSRDMQRIGKDLKGIGAKLSVGVTLPLIGLGVASIDAYKEIDTLKRGLLSVMGSAEAASVEFEKLKEVAKLPGLGLEEAVRGSVNLQAAGFSADEARESLLSFGNALATVGKGKNELNLVVLALSQLQNKNTGFAQDLRQLTEQLPQLRGALKDAFGTNNSEEIQNLGFTGEEVVKKLTKEFGKLPKVTGGIKNAFENASDASSIALAELGEAINKSLNIEGKIESLSRLLTSLVDKFKNLSPAMQKIVVVGGVLAAATGPILVGFGTILTLIPSMVAGFAAVKAAFISFTATIAANPFGAIAVAIGLVVGGLYAYSQANKEVAQTKSTLDKINERAADNLAKERVELERLVSVAKDESKSKVEREKAIKALNKLSPEYLGNLSLETINTDKAKTAIEGYTQALLQKFRVEAAEAELKELVNKRFALELGQLKAKEQLLVAEQKLRSNATTLEREQFEKLKTSLQNGNQLITNFYDAEQRLLEGIINGSDQAIQSSKKLNAELEKTPNRPKLEAIQLPTAQTSSSGTVSALEAEITKLKQLRDQAATTTDQIKLIDAAIKSIEGQIQILVDPTSLIQAETLTTKLATTVSSLSVVMQEVSAAVGDAFTSIGERFIASLGLAETGLEGFAKVMLQTIAKLLSMALANAIVNATQSASATGPAAAFSQPAFIATAVAGVISAFAAIPKFADGGIVGGSSYYGDKILAAVNSGELILNGKQQRNLIGMMAGAVPQNVNIGVQDILLEGSKIRIILDRTDELNNRKK